MLTKMNQATRLAAITKSDVTVYDPPMRGIYVGGAGNLVAVAADDADPVTLPVFPGTELSIAIKKVMAATTATGLVGYW